MQDVPIIIAPPPPVIIASRRDCIVQDGRRYCEDEPPTPSLGYFIVGAVLWAAVVIALYWFAIEQERITGWWLFAWGIGVPLLLALVMGISMVIG